MLTPVASSRGPLIAAGVFGLTGVALGALGAHELKAVLAARGFASAWTTGAHYHMLHALALLGAGVWLRHATGVAGRRLRWAARCWSAGIVLFSGSLYGIALGGPRWLGPITPLGGVALMLGWAFVIATALNEEKSSA